MTTMKHVLEQKGHLVPNPLGLGGVTGRTAARALMGGLWT